MSADDTALSPVVIEADPADRPARLARGWFMAWQVLRALVLLSVVAVVAWAGIEARKAFFLQTDPVRFVGDITNGYNWGSRAAEVGIVQLYVDLEKEKAQEDRPHYHLDYPPLRLAIMTMWARWTRAQYPETKGWQRDYAFSSPVLMLNALAAGLSSLAVFLLVRRSAQLRAASADRPLGLGAGVLVPAVAALMLWWNPAVFLDGYGFVQWDMWILPFFFFAILAAWKNGWFWSGVLLGMGMLIKGQMLWGAPVLLLWAIFAGRWTGALRLIVGIGFGVAVCTSPWSIRQPQGWVWLGTIAVAAVVLLPALLSQGRGRRRHAWLAIPAAGLMGWPLVGQSGLLYAGVFVIAGLLALAWWLPRRALPILLAFAITLAIFACVPRYGGSLAWYRVGFEYGSRKFERHMSTGGTSNLCTILAQRYGWRSPKDTVALPAPIAGVTELPLRAILGGLYVLGVMLCGIAAGVHDRRGSPKMLLALALPFVLFYALMPQMHDRYLIWGALTTVLAVAVSFRTTLLHLLFTLICSVAILWQILNIKHDYMPTLWTIVKGMHTDIAYALLLGALLMLVEVLTPDRRVNAVVAAAT